MSDFLTVNPSSGMMDGSTTITYAANTSNASRAGEVVIRTTGDETADIKTLRLRQLGQRDVSIRLNTTPESLSGLGFNSGSVTATLNILGTATGWNASTESPFLTLSPESGTGTTGTLTIDYPKNLLTTPRVLGEVVVTTRGAAQDTQERLVLGQAGGRNPAAITLSHLAGPLASDVPAGEESIGISYFVLVRNADRSVRTLDASSDAPFVTFARPSQRIAFGSTATQDRVIVNFSVAPNPGASARGATLFFVGTGEDGEKGRAVLELVQQGRGGPTLDVRTVPADLSTLPSAEGDLEAHVDLGGTAEGWRASTTSSSLTLRPSSGTGDGSLTITYTANTGSSSRRAEVLVTTTGGTGMPATHTLMLTQVGQGAVSLTVSTDPPTLGQLPFGMGTVVATLNIVGSATGWRASTTADFLTLEPASGMGTTGRLSIGYTTNPGPGSRTAEVLVATTGATRNEMSTLRLTQVAPPRVPSISLTQLGNQDENILPPHPGLVAYRVTLGGGATGWIAGSSVPRGEIKFLTLAPVTGGDGDILRISYDRFIVGSPRMSTVSVSTTGGVGESARHTIEFRQLDPLTTSLVVTTTPPTLDRLPPAVGTVTANIRVIGPEPGWQASTTADFLSLELASERGFMGTLTITYAANTGTSSRTAEVLLRATTARVPTTKTLTLTQLSTSTSTGHTLAVATTPTALDALPATMGDVTINIDIGGDATGWRASEMANFLTLSPSSGSQDGNLTINYAANTGTSARTAEVLITTTGTGEAATRTLTLTQSRPGVATLTLTTTPADLTRVFREPGRFAVDVDVEGERVTWSARSSASFMTVRHPSFGPADGTLHVDYTRNDGNTPRSGRIVVTLTGNTGVVSIEREVRVTQLTESSPFFLHVPDEVLSEVRFNNPAGNHLNLRSLKVPATLSLYALSGRLSLQTDLEAGNHRIPLDGLPAGIYVLRLAGILGLQPRNYTSLLLFTQRGG